MSAWGHSAFWARSQREGKQKSYFIASALAGDPTLRGLTRALSFGLLGVQNGNLQVAMVANGANRCQRVFPWSGSVTHGNGLGCGTVGSSPVLLVRQVEDHPPDYAHYDWYQATYNWQGLKPSLLSHDHAVITQNDSRFEPSYAVTCGSVRIPS